MVVRPGVRSRGQRLGFVSLVLGAFLLVVGLLTGPALADDPVTEPDPVVEPVVETTLAPVVEEAPVAPETTVVESEREAVATPAAPQTFSLKDSHQNKSYDYEDWLDNDKCVSDGITLLPGQVAWHLVLSGGGLTGMTDGGTTLSSATWPLAPVNPSGTPGGGVQNPGNADWNIINTATTIPADVVAMTDGTGGVTSGGNSSLRVSHTCFGGSSSSSSSVSSSSTEQSSSSSSVQSSSTERSSSSSDDGGALDEGLERDVGVTVTPANGQTLPRTGGNSGTAVTVGGLLLVLGGLFVRYGRPRED